MVPRLPDAASHFETKCEKGAVKCRMAEPVEKQEAARRRLLLDNHGALGAAWIRA